MSDCQKGAKPAGAGHAGKGAEEAGQVHVQVSVL